MRTFPAVLVERVLYRVLACLPARPAARTRPLPTDLTALQPRFAHCDAVDGTTLEALFRKRPNLCDQPTVPLAGHLAGAVDLLSHLPAKLWWADDPATNDQAWAPALVRWLAATSLVGFDCGYVAGWLLRSAGS